MSILLWILFGIRVSAAIAWADGELADEEVAAIERLIDHPSIAADDREMALEWLAAPVEFDEGEVGELSKNQQVVIYRLALRIARSDKDLVDEEWALLDHIRDALGLSVEQALEIEAEVPGYD